MEIEKLKNEKMQNIQDFIKDYFNYTTSISVPEEEWFSYFEWLESFIIDRETNSDDYYKEALKDLLFDLFFNQEGIRGQLENDLGCFQSGSEEFEFIKQFYDKWKYLFNFRIDRLEEN